MSKTILPSAPLPASPSSSTPRPKLKRKRSHTKVACNHCRVKKWACTGERPQCSSCSERGIACVYTSVDKSETHIAVLKRQNEALRKQAEPMEELLNLLKEAPMEIAQMVFLKLRHGDAASVLRFMGGPLGYRQLSEQRAAREVLPSVQSELELELMVRYPVAYPVLAPVADDKLSSPARTGSNMSASKASSPNESSDTTNEMRPLKRQISDGDDKFYSHAGPKPPPQYIDPRLSALNMETWTNVSITNEFAAGAISLYLETDHPVLGLFDADLFVDSLVRGSREFCSPFLVSSLLAYASQGYNAKDPDSLAKSYEFKREAETLADEEISADSLSTLAGFTLLWISHICHGSGKDGLKYVTAGFDMAKRVRLFGVPDAVTTEDLLGLPKEDQSATAHTAWGCFNMSMVQTLFAAPVATAHPPNLPIPGNMQTTRFLDIEDDPPRLRIPFVGVGVSVGDTFQSFCKFWRVASNILLIYRPTVGKPKAKLEFALSEYYKLLNLANHLPETMTYSKSAPSHVFVFHVWYHAVILDTIRPFIAEEDQHGFNQYYQTATSPQAIFAASIKQLKQIILVYSDYPESTYDIWWHIALMYVAGAVVKERTDPEWRPYFMLCMYCYSILQNCFRMVQWIVPGLLGIAVQSGGISSSEALSIQEHFSSQERRSRPGGSGAGFVLDMDRANTDWNAAQADSLAIEFEDMSLFTDFTDGIV